MDTLHNLEQRIAQLILLIKELKTENNKLKQECTELLQKVESLETSVLKGNASIEDEKVLTKMIVDDLIKSIDSLVNENQS